MTAPLNSPRHRKSRRFSRNGRITLGVIVVALVLAASGFALSGSSPNPPAGTPPAAADSSSPSSSAPVGDVVTVVKVVDGDTLQVKTAAGTMEKVRLLVVNAPEVKDCGGSAATAALGARTPVGSTVQLVTDPTQGDRDRYKRLLRYVYFDAGDGLVNASIALAEAGMVRHYDAYPGELSQPVREAQKHAVDGRVGLWASCWKGAS